LRSGGDPAYDFGMEKRAIVEALERIAVLLELRDENPFKIRAYRSGARALEGLTEDLDVLIAEERLGEVPGLGAALVEKITALHQDGRLEFLERLEASVPVGLTALLDVPGLGPKKIQALHRQLGVASPEDLRVACEQGKVAGLPGFGAKTQANILTGLANRTAWSRRHLGGEVQPLADDLVTRLRAAPGVTRAESAGSLRRGLETVGDLDFLVAAEDPGPAMDVLCGHPEVSEVTARGSTKASVRFRSGLQADLRVVPAVTFAYALHHFTGSKDHNVKLRQRALSRGWSLGEWGLVAADEENPPAGWDPEKPPAAQEEADVFGHLGLAYIPPELREGLDELDRAERGDLPELVRADQIRGVFHAHTHASDGSSSLLDMAKAAAAAGYTYLGISDHSKASFQARGLDADRLRRQLDEIRELRASGTLPCHLFAGIECDIMNDGSLDLDDDVLRELDFVIVSVHRSFTMPAAEMTARLVRAIEHPSTTMLGHATGRLLLRREPYAFDIDRIFEAAKAHEVVIEINAAPERLDLDWRHWRRAAAAGVLTSINPDAHDPADFAWVPGGVRIARKAALTPDRVLNTRDLDAVTRWLTERKQRHGG